MSEQEQKPQPKMPQLSSQFMAQAAIEGEQLLHGYANDPANDPLVRRLIATHLQSHYSLIGMLRGVIDLHNEVVKVREANPDVETIYDGQLAKHGLLAAMAAQQYGNRMGDIMVTIDLETQQVNIATVVPQQQHEAGDAPDVPEA